MKRICIIIVAMFICMNIGAQKKSKVLVAYFSATGTTEKVAKQIAETVKADIFVIAPPKAYSDADLDWRNRQSRSSLEMTDKKSRPEMKDTCKEIKQYETIYLGFPIWWGVAPRIINTFIEAHNLKGKTIIPFATSGSSKIDRAEQDLKETYPDLTWKAGKLLNKATAEDIEAFVKL